MDFLEMVSFQEAEETALMKIFLNKPYWQMTLKVIEKGVCYTPRGQEALLAI